VPCVADRAGENFNGISTEARWHVLDREASPLGVTISLGPQWTRLDDVSGSPAPSFAVPAILLADLALVPHRFYLAANLTCGPSFSRSHGIWQQESEAEISVAAAGALAPGLFLGGELRHASKYEGAFLNHLEETRFLLDPACSSRRPNSLP
jgi:hypothetical protein